MELQCKSTAYVTDIRFSWMYLNLSNLVVSYQCHKICLREDLWWQSALSDFNKPFMSLYNFIITYPSKSAETVV